MITSRIFRPVKKLVHDEDQVMVERMFRFDPWVMVYTPLRATIYPDRMSRTWFAIDRPSSVFSVFGAPEIAAVGGEWKQSRSLCWQLWM